MSTGVRRSSHLSRLVESLRLRRDLKPGQLAALLCSSNTSKIGSLIRAFELGEPLSDHWLQRLIAVLQPDPDDLRRCLELDQIEAAEQLELDRKVWESWADEPIEPFLTIRYMPAVYGVREVPRAFCTPRETGKDNAWVRARAEDWASEELKRFRARGFLSWTRRELTWYEKGGVNSERRVVCFEGRNTGAWMQLTGSQRKFLLDQFGHILTHSYGLE